MIIHKSFLPDSFKTHFSGNNPSKPKEDRKPIVAVCDFFQEKVIDIDNDGIPDIPHGLMVWEIARKACPNTKILNIKIDKSIDSIEDHYKKISDAFDKIVDRIDKGEKIQAVNASIGYTEHVSNLANLFDIPITQDNIHLYKEVLRNKIINCSKDRSNQNKQSEKAGSNFEYEKNIRQEEVFPALAKVLESLEKITDKKIPVFVSAGNNGSKFFNPFTLAKGVTSVGSLDKNKQIAGYSAKNSVIKHYEDGFIPVKPIKNNEEIIGYNVTDGDNVDIPIKITSGNRFTCKNINDVLANEEDYKKVKDILDYNELAHFKPSPDLFGLTKSDIDRAYNNVYLIDKISENHKISPQIIEELKKYGDYTDINFSFVLKPDKNGKLKLTHLVRPDDINGTSYAAPVALGKFMQASRSKK